MGLFNFFNRKNAELNSEKNAYSSVGDINNESISDNNIDTRNKTEKPVNGIYFLYNFLDQNFETKGYDDALVNPDNTHLEQNVASLKNDLERNFRKVKTYYEDFIRKTDFHIASRSRSGMIDTVEELQVEKETAEQHIKQLLEMEQDTANNSGAGYGIILSYTRGFRNGLAAISHHSIMNKNF